MSTLAEHYYHVGNDLKIRAAEMERVADHILSMADMLSEEQARMCARANEILEQKDKPQSEGET